MAKLPCDYSTMNVGKSTVRRQAMATGAVSD